MMLDSLYRAALASRSRAILPRGGPLSARNGSGRATLSNGTNPSCGWLSQSSGGWRWLTVLRVPGCIGRWLARHQHWFFVALRSSSRHVISPFERKTPPEAASGVSLYVVRATENSAVGA
jgi:hypothetical protein